MWIKCLIITGTIILCDFGTAINSGHAKINPANIVGMWLFDEAEGESAEDSSGNGNALKLENGIGWTDGVFGQALNFDGQDDIASVDIPDAPQGAAVRTIVGWAKSSNVSDHDGIISYGNPTATNMVFGFLHYENVWVAQLWGPEPWDLKTGVIVDQEWHHHAVLYDGTNLVYYLDGEKIAEAPRNPATSGTILVVGAEPDLNDWFTGLVDEVAIFDVALTENDIANIMENGLEAITAVSALDKLVATWGFLK